MFCNIVPSLKHKQMSSKKRSLDLPTDLDSKVQKKADAQMLTWNAMARILLKKALTLK